MFLSFLDWEVGSNKMVRRYSRVTTFSFSTEVVQLINPLGCENTVEENPTWLVTNFMVMLGGKAG